LRRNSAWVEIAAACLLAFAPPLHAQCADGSPPPCGSRPTANAERPANSVAVLYFASTDTADLFFAEGLSEEIATSLGRVPRLTIKIPSAVRRAQRANQGDVRAIGRALNVKWVVDGSVRRGGGQLRVSVRLVDAEKETAVWSNAVTRSASDPFTIQEDIARNVATEVVGALTPVERAAVATKSTNAEAYEHFLKGNWYVGRRGTWLKRAADEYEAAFKLDPNFGAARAGIALAYMSAADYSIGAMFGMQNDSLRARALALADSVIQRDPSVALAWAVRGSVQRRTGRYTAARQSVARAIALEPNSPEAHYRMAQVHFNSADYAAALLSLDRSLTLDPGRPVTWQLLGTNAYFERRFPEALRMLDTALSLDPQFQGAYAWKAVVLYATGDTAGAERVVATRLAALGSAATVDDRAYATINMVGHAPPQTLAQLGRYDEALTTLGPWLLITHCRHIARDPAFDPVRRDPRFTKFSDDCFKLPEPR
jgi:adenylate cyclase